ICDRRVQVGDDRGERDVDQRVRDRARERPDDERGRDEPEPRPAHQRPDPGAPGWTEAVSSTSTGAPPGSRQTPTAVRAGRPPAPTWRASSADAPSATAESAVNPAEQAT